MRRLFIYYRVLSSRADEALPALQGLLEQARARYPGLQTELLRRPEERDGLQTWMEVYSHPDGIDDDLLAWLSETTRRVGVAGFTGNLYVEIFVPCAS